METRAISNRHIIWIAAGFILLMFIAFTPTYFSPVVKGTFDGPPIFHLHGALFFTWPVLFLLQAILAERGRLNLHRSLGLVGIVLATSMFFTGIAAVARDLRANEYGLALIAFAGLILFSIFVTLALVYRRRREYHLRWMFLATLALMQAVSARFVARVVLDLTPSIGAPQMEIVQRAGMIHLLFDVLVLVTVCVWEWRKRGKPHPAILVGGAALILIHAFRHLALETSAWRASADLILALTR